MDTTSDSALQGGGYKKHTADDQYADQYLQQRSPADDAPPAPVSGAGLGGKEQESSRFDLQEQGVSDQSKEIELPQEVERAGVRTQPQSATIDPSLQKMGMKQSGPTQQMGDGSSVSLPLDQTHISQGMKMSVKHSWRWLAEWCSRQIKKMQIVLSSKK